MVIYWQIQRVTTLHNKVAKLPKQKHWRKSLCLDPVFWLDNRDHCRVPFYESMKAFYSQPLQANHWVRIEGETKKYVDSKGEEKQEIIPYKIEYLLL